MKRQAYVGSCSTAENVFRRGAMLVMVALLMPVFLVMAAFTLDVAYMQLVATQLRSSTDAATRAGVEALARTQDAAQAKTAAIAIAAQNTVAGRPLKLAESDIVLGRVTQQSDGSWAFVENQSPYNAMRIKAELKAGNANGAVPLLFAGAIGQGSFQTHRVSTAAFQENDICLVVDRSHSMCFDLTGPDWSYPPNTPNYPNPVCYPPNPVGSRWAALEVAVDAFLVEIQSANSSNHLSLATFGSVIDESDTADWYYTHTYFDAVTLEAPLSIDHAVISTKVHQLGDQIMQGGTHMSEGMRVGIEELTGSRSRPLSTKIMVLMTDGKWNEGTPPKSLANQARAKGIIIHTITFLPGSNQADMIEVANITGGRHFHAENEADLVQIYREIARSLPVILVE